MRTRLYVAFGLILLLLSCVKNKKDDNHNLSDQILQEDTFTALKKEVFGFHPYWQEGNQENYNYNILTAIAYFEFKLDPDSGVIKEEPLLKSPKLIRDAQAKGVKVYLTITNFTQINNRKFFSNKDAQNASLDNISKLLDEHNAYGVVIDFEDIPNGNKDEYTSYIKALSNHLKAKGNRSIIIALPGNLTEAFNVKALNDHVEFFIIMGKNYNFGGSENAGPVAPLRMGTLWSGSLENSVKNYLENGVKRDKLILSLPYYGSVWETTYTTLPSKNIKLIEHLSYKRIKKKYPIQPLYEPFSQSAYLNIKNGNTNTQIWFDDEITLGAKYDFIIDNELAGVAIWALGYDDGYNELWNVLEEKFKN